MPLTWAMTAEAGARCCMMHKRKLKSRPAFSLLEVLIVVVVLGIAAALLLPSLQAAREAGRRTVCRNHLRQIGLALQHYHDAHGKFPPGSVERFRLRHAWSTSILPFLEQSEVWSAYDFRSASRSAANRQATSAVIPTYLCPSTRRWSWDRTGQTTGDKNGNGAYDPGDEMGYIDYGGMFGEARPGSSPGNGLLIRDQSFRIRQVTDGLSRTIIAGEDTGRGWVADGEWANGENIFDVTVTPNRQQFDELWSDHPGGVQVVMADASVRFVDELITLPVLAAICTRAGREIVSHDEF